MKKYLYEIIYLLGDDRKKLPRLVAVFFFASLLDIAGIGLIGPYVSIVIDPESAKDIINKYFTWIELPAESYSLLMVMSILLIIVFAFKTIAVIWINYIIIKFSTIQRIKLTSLLMNSYQNLPYEEYLLRNSSEYIHNTQNLVNDYSGGLLQAGLRIVSDGIVGLVVLIMLIITNPEASLILVGLLGIFLFFYDRVFRKKIKIFGAKSNEATVNLVKGIHEGIEGLKEIRILENEKYFFDQVKRNTEKAGKYGMYSTIISTIPRYLIEFTMIFFVVMLVIIALIKDANLQDLMPTLAVFGLAAVRMMPIANTMSNGLIRFRFNRDSVSRLYVDAVKINENTLTNKSNCKKKAEDVSINDTFKTLVMENVSFYYQNSKQKSLTNINLKIKHGDSIGIIGESGSGKTTLVDTILGLLNPSAGTIYFNGKPLKEVKDIWRKNIAYLPQQIFLIDSTIKGNVAMGVQEKNIDVKLLYRSLNMALLSDLVDQLPDGIDTMLGERGVRLSGGQRQRIALARAFYHKRNVLIMDESTSALDSETEKEIVREIKNLKGNITTIVIAHRLSTIEHCDTIFKLSKGRIIGYGPPKEMIK